LKRVYLFAILFVSLLIILIVYLNVSRRIDQNTLLLSGVIEAEEYELSFRIPGLIDAIYYDEADVIDSGAVVAELDKREPETALKQAEKNHEAAGSAVSSFAVNLETIERNLNKLKALLSTGAATQSQYDDLFDQKRQVEAQLHNAQKMMEAAGAAVDMARIKYEYSVLKSYIKGTVLFRMYQPGEIVMAGSPVITLSDLDRLTLKVYLPEKYLGKVKLGQAVNIRIDSYPDRKFPGQIEYIADKAEFTPKNIQTREERVKQVFAVEIASDSQGGVLKPGLPADVIIELVNE
jgi:HlyD family secretion protein